MKVILIKDVPSLGRKDDVKDVADGYARNFLLPKNLVVVASSALLRVTEQKQAEKVKVADADMQKIETLIKKLSGYEIKLEVEAAEEGTLYAGVGFEELKIALAAKKLDISGAELKSTEALKTLGKHVVTLEFPHNLKAEVTVVLAGKVEVKKKEKKKTKKK